MSSTRQLAAIMFTDIVGYTALMGKDEQKAFDLLRKNRQIQQPLIKRFNGTWIKELGDGVLASFPTATDAVLCAYAIKQSCMQVPGLQLRIGVHQGDVVFENADIFGDGVNIASRLQALAPAGEIWVSEAVYTNVKNKPGIEAEFVGEETLKNVSAPVKIFQINSVGGDVLQPLRIFETNNVPGERKRSIVKKLIPSLLGLILLFAIGSFFYFRNNKKNNITETGISQSTDNSIAVLPFTNMSNDPAQDYFADGMMDEILNDLFKIGGWRIISRTSATAYKGTKKTIKQIANELGVAHLLQGSVQKEGQHIRIRVQLIDGKTDEHLWAETYERDFKDVFAIQSDIAQSVANALKVAIAPEVKQRIEQLPTANMEAYTLYLKALHVKVTTPEEFWDTRKKLLDAAAAGDSTFAEVYVEQAWDLITQGTYHEDLTPNEVFKQAESLLHKALRLNPNLAIAHIRFAEMYLWYKWDFKRVQEEFVKVRQLNPSNTEAVVRFTDFLLAKGNVSEAFHICENAFAKDSSSYFIRVQLALAYYFNNNPQKALETAEAAITKFPNDFWVLQQAIRINNYAADYKKAASLFEKYKTRFPAVLRAYVWGHGAIAYYKTGSTDSAETYLNKLKKTSEQSSVRSPSFFLAAVYTAMGKNDLAIQSLEKAFRNHEVEMYWLKVEPLFKPLHGDARFQNLVNRIGYSK